VATRCRLEKKVHRWAQERKTHNISCTKPFSGGREEGSHSGKRVSPQPAVGEREKAHGVQGEREGETSDAVMRTTKTVGEKRPVTRTTEIRTGPGKSRGGGRYSKFQRIKLMEGSKQPGVSHTGFWRERRTTRGGGRGWNCLEGSYVGKP